MFNDLPSVAIVDSSLSFFLLILLMQGGLRVAWLAV